MENILEINGFETITAKIEQIKEGEQMEKTLQAQNETFNVTIDKANNRKLTLIFTKAHDKVAQILNHREVEKDIQKAKETFYYGNFFG